VFRKLIMKQYNKLVRDNIPAIIKASGGVPHTTILNNDDYLKALGNKLVEEALEAKQTPIVEELADVMEVLLAIAENQGISLQEIEKARIKKNQTNGSFEKRIFLESTD
jgi:predicted house-cleaning noncanonical NTP pyrophosphatase (MazG superfamily)